MTKWQERLVCKLWFDSDSSQTNDLIGVHVFLGQGSALKRQCGEQAGKFFLFKPHNCSLGFNMSEAYTSLKVT